MRNTVLLLCTLSLVGGARADCELSDALVYRANELHNQGKSAQEQIAVLRHAVEVCPGNAYAHNNLANQLGELGRLDQAEAHYRSALAHRPDLVEAWFGLGELHGLRGQLPQALQAYLHACAADADARSRAVALLKDNRFTDVAPGQVLDRDALLLLFDPVRRGDIAGLARDCGLGANRAVMEANPRLRNFEFATGEAVLTGDAVNRRQLDEIAAALAVVAPQRRIVLQGHSDDQPFRRVSRDESDRLNLQLSRQRADTIRRALASRGIAVERVDIHGYGATRPLSDARQRNRRVEIEVR